MSKAVRFGHLPYHFNTLDESIVAYQRKDGQVRHRDKAGGQDIKPQVCRSLSLKATQDVQLYVYGNACGCSRGVKTGQFPNSSLVPVPVQRLQQSCLATLNSAIRFSQSRFAAITYCKEVLGGRLSKKLAHQIGSEGTKKDLSFRNCHSFFSNCDIRKKKKKKKKKC